MSPTAVEPLTFVGVDGCKGGWIAIGLGDDGAVTGHKVATLTEIPARFPSAVVIGVDMPLGAPARGGRLADQLARQQLGPRRSSIFNTPVRDALTASSYEEANAISRRLAGKGLSKQSFALAPKIVEATAFAAHSPTPVFEVHPELSFRYLLGGPAVHRKTTWAGVHERLHGLAAAGIHLPDLGADGGSVPPDDVLDAAVVAWSARRIHLGLAVCLPDPPERLDGHPGTVAIWA